MMSNQDVTGASPSRIAKWIERAKPLVDCDHRANRPSGERERIVGFVIDQDDIGLGLSEPLFALEALTQLARYAIAMEGGDTAE